jgi:hypothetical protein
MSGQLNGLTKVRLPSDVWRAKERFQVVNRILRHTENPAEKSFDKNPILTPLVESHLEMKGLGLNENTLIVCPLQSSALISREMTVKAVVFHILLPKTSYLNKIFKILNF